MSGPKQTVKRVAALQMNSSDDRKQNLQTAAELIIRAAGAGAELLLLPENFSGIPAAGQDKYNYCEQYGNGMAQDFLARQASLHRLWLIAGSIWLRNNTSGSAHNSCLVYTPEGVMAGRYDKMHMFDVQLTTDNTTNDYCESDFFTAGDAPVTVTAGGVCIGLSICYDLRFPELYRKLQDMGAELIVVPSAFTATTGKLHWEVLLRTRAVENQCFVLAANQHGRHSDGKQSWGHSMVIDPRGNILSSVTTGNGIALCDCDWGSMRAYRERFPALRHRRKVLATIASDERH